MGMLQSMGLQSCHDWATEQQYEREWLEDFFREGY